MNTVDIGWKPLDFWVKFPYIVSRSAESLLLEMVPCPDGVIGINRPRDNRVNQRIGWITILDTGPVIRLSADVSILEMTAIVNYIQSNAT